MLQKRAMVHVLCVRCCMHGQGLKSVLQFVCLVTISLFFNFRGSEYWKLLNFTIGIYLQLGSVGVFISVYDVDSFLALRWSSSIYVLALHFISPSYITSNDVQGEKEDSVLIPFVFILIIDNFTLPYSRLVYYKREFF